MLYFFSLLVIQVQLYCILVGPGISSYVATPSDVKGPLTKCLEEAKRTVPPERRNKTPVFLGATAGMRMLK